MGVSDFNRIFSANLKSFLSANDMSQLDLSKKLGVGTTSVSNWCKGLKVPRMDKVDAMCKIFNCKRSDLMDDHSSLEEVRARPSLSPDQEQLLADYDQLNAEGKEEARKQVRNLTKIKDYTQDTASSAGKLA